MVESIHQQREVLDSLEAAAAEADQRIGLAELRATKLEENKAELELEIAELRRQRDGLTENIDQDKLKKRCLCPLGTSGENCALGKISFKSSLCFGIDGI